MKLLILGVGRIKDRAIEGLVSDYLKRIRCHLPIELRSVRRTEDLLRHVPSGWEVVALDERGRQVTSMGFSHIIEERMQHGRSGIVFLVGPAEGLGDLVQKADWSLALSQMTLPHRLVYLVLAEQLYRALSIIRGEPYHKA
ncbi:MAG: 23S rRNA (pseudouridine(1915)-N(3))-methyltransferase RlmH [Deltaproteobacteria bacterium]|nr:23S rRNA (pseudouridine(1915)-N(3))-methyltransferase RlmH [Deltaproteobacteria bacterium]